MRRLMPAAVVLLVVVAILPAIADKAKAIYEKGQDAEARQNFEAAYDLYKQAYDLKPKDLRYRASFERMRFKAAATIVHHGQGLRDRGQAAGGAGRVSKGGADRSVAFHRAAGVEAHAADD